MQQNFKFCMKKYAKYLITLAVFAVIFLFVGEQSMVRSIHRARQIHRLEQTRDTYQQQIDDSRSLLRTLESTDSLERYAREHYYMHADGEMVYVIDD